MSARNPPSPPETPATRDPARVLREAARDVLAAYDFCRSKGSFSGFWTHIDDLAKALDAYPIDAAPETPATEGTPKVAFRGSGSDLATDVAALLTTPALVAEFMAEFHGKLPDSSTASAPRETPDPLDVRCPRCRRAPGVACEDGAGNWHAPHDERRAAAARSPPPEAPASAPSRGTDHDPGEMDCTCIAPHPACPNCNGTGRYQR